MNFGNATQATFLLNLLLAANFLLLMVVSVLRVVDFFRRKPPLDKQLALFIQRPDMERLETRLDAKLEKLEKRHETFAASTGHMFQDIMRSIGRLERRGEDG